MNLLLLAASVVLVFGAVVFIQKLIGKEGLVGWLGIASIIANILILKSVSFGSLEATLGNVMFASNFLATDIITELYGYREAKKAVKFGLVSVLVFLASTQFALLFIPNELDFAQPIFKEIFGFFPRITIASVSLFAISNFVDVNLYEAMRKRQGDKRMWLRNNTATIISNCTENYVFYMLAFYGKMGVREIIMLGTTATIIEAVVALLDTPFLYIAKYSNKKQEGGEGLSLKENTNRG